MSHPSHPSWPVCLNPISSHEHYTKFIVTHLSHYSAAPCALLTSSIPSGCAATSLQTADRRIVVWFSAKPIDFLFSTTSITDMYHFPARIAFKAHLGVVVFFSTAVTRPEREADHLSPSSSEVKNSSSYISAPPESPPHSPCLNK